MARIRLIFWVFEVWESCYLFALDVWQVLYFHHKHTYLLSRNYTTINVVRVMLMSPPGVIRNTHRPNFSSRKNLWQEMQRLPVPRCSTFRGCWGVWAEATLFLGFSQPVSEHRENTRVPRLLFFVLELSIGWLRLSQSWHHSLSCFQLYFIFFTHWCQICVMVWRLSLTSLHFTDVTLDKSLVLLTFSWCLLSLDLKLTHILLENCFLILARTGRILKEAQENLEWPDDHLHLRLRLYSTEAGRGSVLMHMELTAQGSKISQSGKHHM